MKNFYASGGDHGELCNNSPSSEDGGSGAKSVGDRVDPIEQQIGHDLPDLGRHAKADLEAAIGDLFPRPRRVMAQHRRAAGGAGAHPGPAGDDFGALQDRKGGDGPRDHVIKARIGAGRISEITL